MTRDVAGSLTGSFPVLPTPLYDDESIDFDSYGEVIDRVLDQGIKGLTVLGSGGESVYLTETERCAVVEYAVKRIEGRATVLCGVICFGTSMAVEQTKRFRDLGADAVMVAVPQYFETPLSQLIVHYDAIAKGGELPTLYYHFPSPTHLELSPEQVAEIFSQVPLVGIKNSSVNTQNVLDMIGAIDRPIQVFSGQSFDCLACMNGGAVGAICPVALLLPKTSLRLVDAQRADHQEAAQEAQNRFYQAIPFVSPEQTEEGAVNVAHAGIKEALHELGIIKTPRVRDPQPTFSEKRRTQIRELARTLVEL